MQLPGGPTIRLAHGQNSTESIEIPIIGLGVYQSEPGKTTQAAVEYALGIGYRHIDTAMSYRNEASVGEAVRCSGLDRSEVFVTTKLWSSQHGYEGAIEGLESSLSRLGFGYVDLYLIHAPPDPDRRAETWRGMQKALALGMTRSIGVSNFGLHHLDEILALPGPRPCINQIEISPYLSRPSLVSGIIDRDIVIEAYSPLTKAIRLDDERLQSEADRLGCSAAQLLIAWGLDCGYVSIPKSVTPERIKENLSALDVKMDESARQALSKLEEGLVTGWDPTTNP